MEEALELERMEKVAVCQQEEKEEDCLKIEEQWDYVPFHREDEKTKKTAFSDISQIQTQFEKKTKEMRRTREYMKKTVKKSEFELIYNSCFPMFEKEAYQACNQLANMKSQELGKLEKSRYGFIHGDYQHHNILRTRNGIATVNFSHFQFHNQLQDLYLFLRKALEKNSYQYEIANKIIKGYDQECELELADYEYLYVMLLYPDKFWKISNRNYNSKKTWVPPKNVEKLRNVMKQNEQKSKFLLKFKLEYLN